jgi:hypothetical protein
VASIKNCLAAIMVVPLLLPHTDDCAKDIVEALIVKPALYILARYFGRVIRTMAFCVRLAVFCYVASWAICFAASILFIVAKLWNSSE